MLKHKRLIIILLPVLLILTGLFTGYIEINSGPQRLSGESASQPPTQLPKENSPCVPTFADGGGPYYKANSPFRTKIAPDINNGERLIVSGKVLQKDCITPVSGAILDIWQANESGSYQDVWYRGKVRADNEGNYSFESVIPKGYGEGTGYRPPHIHFKVFIAEKEIITSQIFFPEVKGTPGFEDAYIMRVESKNENGSPVHYGNHNIILP